MIVDRWNSIVKPEDEVFVVGDVFLGRPSEAESWIRSLCGRKVLIVGNHDRSPTTMKSLGFDEAHRSLTIQVGERRVLLRHKPMPDSVIDPHDLQVHGHHHTGEKVNGRRINVAADIWDFYPVPETYIETESLGVREHDSISIEMKDGYADVRITVKMKYIDGLTDVLNDAVREHWEKGRRSKLQEEDSH